MSEKYDDLSDRIARAHLHGEGSGVREIWDLIAKGEMQDCDIVTWAKIVANWIAQDPPNNLLGEADLKTKASRRLAAMHVGMTVTGAAEPQKDTLEDEHYLFLCASGKHGLRGAAEAIWKKINVGTATQGLREMWLDHIAGGVVTVIKEDPPSNKRTAMLTRTLGLNGKQREHKVLNLVETLYWIRSNFPKSAYVENPKSYVADFVKRLRVLGIIQNDGVDIERHIREMIRKRPPRSK
jgi:hypothetical protein